MKKNPIITYIHKYPLRIFVFFIIMSISMVIYDGSFPNDSPLVKTKTILNQSKFETNETNPIALDGNTAVDEYFQADTNDGLSWETAYRIENLNIKGTMSIPGGIYIKNSERYIRITNCSISLFGSLMEDNGGIFILNSAHVRIENCTTIGYRNTIFIKNSEDVQIVNCTTRNGIEDGIHLFYAKNCVVENNIVHDNPWYGICLKFSNDTIVKNNLIHDNMHEGIYVTECKNLTLIANEMKNNNAYGINFRRSYGSLIANNTYEDNGYGPIQVSGGENNLILDEEYGPPDDSDNDTSDTSEKKRISGLTLSYFSITIAFGIIFLIISQNRSRKK